MLLTPAARYHFCSMGISKGLRLEDQIVTSCFKRYFCFLGDGAFECHSTNVMLPLWLRMVVCNIILGPRKAQLNHLISVGNSI